MLDWFRRSTPVPQRDYAAEAAARDAKYQEETLEYLKRYDASRLRHLQDENKRLRVTVGELVYQLEQAHVVPRVSRIALDADAARKFSTVHDMLNDAFILTSEASV